MILFNAFLPDVLPCLNFRNAPTPVMICLNEVSSWVEGGAARVEAATRRKRAGKLG